MRGSQLLVTVGLLVLVVLPACRRGAAPPPPPVVINRTYSKPVPELPPPGQVRIVGAKVQEDSKTVKWRWTIFGDRNWVEFAGSDQGVELRDSYPLNDTGRGGGTNAFECELILTLVEPKGGKARLESSYTFAPIGTQLTGDITVSISGGGVSGRSTLWPDINPVPPGRMVTAKVAGDQIYDLPLDLVVVEILGETPDGQPLEATFRIKVKE
jgi:hypothetical protein